MDCIFCKIAAGEIPSSKVYEDEQVLAFNDINPQAPVHVLVIPKKHIGSAVEIKKEDAALIAHIFEVIKIVAKEQNLDNGFRLVTNIGADGGQSVKHLHFHVLGKKQYGENFG